MALSNLVNRAGPFAANGSTRNWPYSSSFPIIEATTEIEIWLISASGALSQVTTAYEVDTDLGEVVYPTVASGLDPVATGNQILLLRVMPITQETDLQTQGSFNAETIETALDKLTALIQQLQEQIDRSLKVDLTEEEGDPTTLMAQMNAAVVAAETAETNAETAETAAEAAQVAAAASAVAAAASAVEAAATVSTRVIAPATNTANYIPQWDGANSKTLKDGIEKSTDGTMGDNSDSAVPTEKAVVTYVATKATDAGITTTDVTTNNVSTSKHGFAPKAPNNTTTFLRGDATWGTPPDTGLKLGVSFCNTEWAEVGDADMIAASRFKTSQACVINSLIHFFSTGAACGKIRIGIYTDSTNYPGTLLAETGELTVNATNEVNGAISGAITAQTLTANTYYWLAIVWDDALTPGCTGSGKSAYKAQTYGAMPATFPAAGGTDRKPPAIGAF